MGAHKLVRVWLPKPLRAEIVKLAKQEFITPSGMIERLLRTVFADKKLVRATLSRSHKEG